MKVKKIKKDIALNNIMYTVLNVLKEMVILILGYLVTISYFLFADGYEMSASMKELKHKSSSLADFDSFAYFSNVRKSIKGRYYEFLYNYFNADNKRGILLFYFILIILVESFYYITFPTMDIDKKNKYTELIYSFIIKALGVVTIPLILFLLFLYIIILINSMAFIVENLRFDHVYIIIPAFFLIIYLSWGVLFSHFINNIINDFNILKIENVNIIAIIALITVILIDYLCFYDKAAPFICSSLTFMTPKVFNFFIKDVINNKSSLFTFPYLFALFISLYMGYTIWSTHNLFYIPLLLIIISLSVILYYLYPSYDKDYMNMMNNNNNNNNNNINNNNINNNNNNINNNFNNNFNNNNME